MGPLGKVIKPLINLAAIATGNPYIVIATSVTLGALDNGAEGAVKGLMPGIAGAAGQQLALAQQVTAQEVITTTTQQITTTTLTETIATEAFTMAGHIMPMLVNAPNGTHQPLFKSILGMGLGTLASTTSVPFLLKGQDSFVIALGEGSVYGLVSASVSGADIGKAIIKGAGYAGLGDVLEVQLSQTEWSDKLKDAVGAAITSTVHLVVDKGKLSDVIVSVGTTVIGNMIDNETVKTAVTGVITSIASGADLGNMMVASSLGRSVQRIARQTGESLGERLNNTTEQIELKKKVEKIREKEIRIHGKAITPSWDKVQQWWWYDEKNVKAYSKKLNTKFEKFKPPTKKDDPSWWAMFKRAFNGDTSPDVIKWQQNNINQKHMQYIKAVCDGATKGTEIGTPIREVGLTILGGGVGAVGVGAVAKGAGKLLFSYKMYQKAEQASRPKITGGRSAWEKADYEEKIASKIYEEIRNCSKDVQQISKNLNLQEFQVQRVKDHLFYKEHQLNHDLGVRKFHPDLKIAETWKRFEAGNHTEADIKIFKHEYFESKFEGIFRTDYNTAHKAANRAGYPSGLENDNVIMEVTNGITNRH